MVTPIDDKNESNVQFDQNRFEEYLKGAFTFFGEGNTYQGFEFLQKAMNLANHDSIHSKVMRSIVLKAVAEKNEEIEVRVNCLLHSLFNLINTQSVSLELKDLNSIQLTSESVRETLIADLNRSFENNDLSKFGQTCSKEELYELIEILHSLINLKLQNFSHPSIEKLKMGRLGYEQGKLQALQKDRFPNLQYHGGLKELNRTLNNALDIAPTWMLTEEVQHHVSLLEKKDQLLQTAKTAPQEPIYVPQLYSPKPKVEEKEIEQPPLFETETPKSPSIKKKKRAPKKKLPTEPKKNEHIQEPKIEEKIELTPPKVHIQESTKPLTEKEVEKTTPQTVESEVDVNSPAYKIGMLKKAVNSEDCNFNELIHQELENKTKENPFLTCLKYAIIYYGYYKQKEFKNTFHLEICERNILAIKHGMESNTLNSTEEVEHLLAQEVAELEQNDHILKGEIEHGTQKREKRLGIF